jgi:hypothetical protein
VPAVKNGPVEFVWIAAGALVATLMLLSLRRRPPSSPDPSEAVRRDLGRLAEDLKAAVRDQVDRLDREVRRLKEAVAEAERARMALEEARRESAPPKPAPEKAAKPASNPLHSRVFELRDSGKEPADIGVETGLEVGEVELILGLRRMPPRA